MPSRTHSGMSHTPAAVAQAQPAPAQPPISLRERQRKPWKYEGYPAFSRWMASSDDFLVLRRFGHLNTRAILLMQDRIARKEEELEKLDTEAQYGPDAAGDSSTFRHEPIQEREEILDELIGMLRNYNDFITSYSSLRYKKARPKQAQNVRNWFFNHTLAISPVEQNFIEKEGDLFTLVNWERRSYLKEKLENIKPLGNLFRKQHREDRQFSPYTTYQSDTMLEFVANALVILVGLAMLLGPLWILQFVGDNVRRLAIITGFVVLFALTLFAATQAKPFETVAATAAYSAVLMVFLQIDPA
ncbi:hypothetical protein MKZ38_000967 [Zalerion maritima]|uniref:DUF6594 domain-containing protein n=1 Tax=Zalerion maritima TaxID=339359 RepID=A0AAD5RQW8_9PEZI|nr:hypothetical protein MKZ38_000967 [Zalerion maritima]